MKKAIVAAALFVTLVSQPARAFTANQFLAMPESNQAIWIHGVLQGLNVGMDKSKDAEGQQRYDQCMTGVTIGELLTGFKKFLGEHPDLLETDAIDIFGMSLGERCKAKSQPG